MNSLERFARALTISFSYPRIILYVVVAALIEGGLCSLVGAIFTYMGYNLCLGSYCLFDSGMLLSSAVNALLVALVFVLLATVMLVLLVGYAYMCSAAFNYEAAHIFASLRRAFKRFNQIFFWVAAISVLLLGLFYLLDFFNVPGWLTSVLCFVIGLGLIFVPFVLAFENRGVVGTLTHAISLSLQNILSYLLLLFLFTIFGAGCFFIIGSLFVLPILGFIGIQIAQQSMHEVALIVIHHPAIQLALMTGSVVFLIIATLFKNGFFIALTSLYRESSK